VREWVIVKRLAAASLALSSCLLPFLHPSWRNPGLEILLRLTPCPIPRTHAPALTSAYPCAAPRASTPSPLRLTPPVALSTQPPVPSTLCLVRWWRHLVQFNKRRSIMTSASELPLSSLTLADSLPLLLLRPSPAWPRVLTPSISLSLSLSLFFTHSLMYPYLSL